MTPFQSSTGSAEGTTRSSKVSSAGRNLNWVLVRRADVLRGRVVMMRLPEQILHFGFEPAIASGCSAESCDDSGPGPTRLTRFQPSERLLDEERATSDGMGILTVGAMYEANQSVTGNG